MPEITVNGRKLQVSSGISVAAAVWDSGATEFRTSVKGTPRGPLCGMGICFECRVTVDGQPHARSCMLPVRDGMKVETC